MHGAWGALGDPQRPPSATHKAKQHAAAADGAGKKWMAVRCWLA